MAERERFELSVAFNNTRFPGVRNRPLCHLSARAGNNLPELFSISNCFLLKHEESNLENKRLTHIFQSLQENLVKTLGVVHLISPRASYICTAPDRKAGFFSLLQLIVFEVERVSSEKDRTKIFKKSLREGVKMDRVFGAAGAAHVDVRGLR